MTERVWFITGSSTGLGRALAMGALASGARVVASARNVDSLRALQDKYGDRVLPVGLDVTSPSEIAAAVAAARERFGRIDVLVNNAGYGLFGAFEEISNTDARQQFEVNVFGLFAVTRAVLPVMRAQGRGHILNVSSVGGRVAFPALSVYHATKFAVEGMSESLAQEIAQFGIKVTIIEPGSFRTDWSGRSAVFADASPTYADTPAGHVRRIVHQRSGQEPGDPARAATAIIHTVESENPPLRLPLGADAFSNIRSRFQQDLEAMSAIESLASNTSFAAV